MKLYLQLIIIPFVFSVIFCSPIYADSPLHLELAQKVFDKLFDVSGQYIHKKPKLELDTENQRVAAYVPSKNLITIDEKALAICASMGSDAENALAFIIGHELAHAFQKEVRNGGETTSFLSYDKHIHSSIRTEKVADIQGVFTGYLADYGMQTAIPIVLEMIYEEYELAGVKLPNYPPFKERTNSAKEVVEMVDNLIDLYELTPNLIALEKNDLAIISLEYILEYYQGYEIQNNLGAAYLFSAMDLINIETDKYSYPITIDSSSNLKVIDISRGPPPPLNHMEKLVRNNILTKSVEYFESAIKFNNKYTIAKINKACALNLLNEPNRAIDFLNSKAFLNHEKKSLKYKMIYAISEALLNRKDKAAILFNSIKAKGNPLMFSIADYNYRKLKGTSNDVFEKNTLDLPDWVIQQSNHLKLGRTREWKPLQLSSGEKTDENIYFKKNKDRQKKSYSFGGDFRNYFSIVISNGNKKGVPLVEDVTTKYNFHNMVLGKNCVFINSKEDNLIVKLDNNGYVLEIARYYIHN